MQPSGESLIDKGASAAKPWSKKSAWWLVLTEGLVLLGVGLYMIVAPDNTQRLLGWVLAVTLAVMGLLELTAALRMRTEGRVRQATLIQGAVGLIIGVLVVILLLADALTFDSGRIILGFGSVAFGLLGGYRYFAFRSARLPRSGVVMGLFFLVVGVLALLAGFGVGDVQTYLQVIAILLMVCGVVLIGWAFGLKRRPRKAVTAAASSAKVN